MKLKTIQELAAFNDDLLETLLHRRLGNRIRDLRVVATAEGIVLQGRTATYHAKQLAQHAAMDMSRRPIIANEIVVC